MTGPRRRPAPAAGSYRHLDHTGDIGIEAEAPDAPALFAVCARALFDIIAGEGAVIEERSGMRIDLEAPDRETLLLRWLRELLYLHDTERWLFASFEISLTLPEAGDPARLAAEARGEIHDPARHRLQTELKAVTYHQLEVARDPGGSWRARVIFDV